MPVTVLLQRAREIGLGGVCIAAHPFRDNNRGMGPFESSLRLAHGIEVLNGNTTAQDNSNSVFPMLP